MHAAEPAAKKQKALHKPVSYIGPLCALPTGVLSLIARLLGGSCVSTLGSCSKALRSAAVVCVKLLGSVPPDVVALLCTQTAFGTQCLESLDLNGNLRLHKLPDLRRCSQLRQISLTGCKNLHGEALRCYQPGVTNTGSSLGYKPYCSPAYDCDQGYGL